MSGFGVVSEFGYLADDVGAGLIYAGYKEEGPKNTIM